MITIYKHLKELYVPDTTPFVDFDYEIDEEKGIINLSGFNLKDLKTHNEWFKLLSYIWNTHDIILPNYEVFYTDYKPCNMEIKIRNWDSDTKTVTEIDMCITYETKDLEEIEKVIRKKTKKEEYKSAANRTFWIGMLLTIIGVIFITTSIDNLKKADSIMDYIWNILGFIISVSIATSGVNKIEKTLL